MCLILCTCDVDMHLLQNIDELCIVHVCSYSQLYLEIINFLVKILVYLFLKCHIYVHVL